MQAGRAGGPRGGFRTRSGLTGRWALARLDPATRTRVETHRRAALAELVASPPVAPPGARESLGLPDEETARAMAASLAAGLGAAEMPV